MYNRKHLFLFYITAIGSTFSSAHAGSEDQARKLYSSLTGVNPTAAEVNIVAAKIASGNALQAARDIVDSQNGMDSKGSFYNVTVKNFATPWTNVDYTKMYPLTDLTATVIGWVRDEKQFNKILYSDTVYVASGISMAGNKVTTSLVNSLPLLYSSNTTSCESIPVCTFCKEPAVKRGRILFIDPQNPNSTSKLCRFTGLTSAEFTAGVSSNHYYIPASDSKLSTGLIKSTNAMYEEMENLNLNLSSPRILTEKSQAVRLHQDEKAISGIMTTRAWGQANYTAGTNRRAFQSTMKHIFCKEMMEVNDTNTPDFRVRRDVDRSPGGTSATFKALCVGCHAVMDPHVGALAYYSFPNGAIQYNQGVVVAKMNHNALFPKGFITQDDSWLNLSNQGQNATFGWGPQSEGNGLTSLATMYSETKEFHKCMAKTVFKTVCHREAHSDSDKNLVKLLALNYEEDNFNMKKLFMNTSVACMGK
ncbi:MAG: hypothetical protein HOP07_13615 [Bacteriovoracaceae bacterium]|nr:hypothetical protein [Bacteriovoracaceae bacterium]